MSIVHLFATRNSSSRWFLLFAIVMLSACNPRESELAEREAMISARESELVSLFSELIELRKSWEKNQPDKLSAPQENANRGKASDCSCNTPAGTASFRQDAAAQTENKTLLGGIEHVYLDPPGLEFSARIDTGARTSSLNAIDIVEFERDGKPFVKFSLTHPQTGEMIELTRRLRRHVRVKERGDREAQRRPVVRLRVALADINEQIDFTLENRSKFKHQVLIGRNLLNDLAIVDVSKKFTALKTDHLESSNPK